MTNQAINLMCRTYFLEKEVNLSKRVIFLISTFSSTIAAYLLANYEQTPKIHYQVILAASLCSETSGRLFELMAQVYFNYGAGQTVRSLFRSARSAVGW